MKILMTAVLLAGGFSPLTAGSFADLSSQAPASEIKLPAPVAVPAQDKAVQSWADAAKTAFEREIEAGGLTNFADLKELPPGARRQLEKELATLPEGPGNTSEAFKLNVNGRTAFIVQSYIYDDNMRAWIFNAAGVPVAYGEGSVDKPFTWLPLPAAARSAGSAKAVSFVQGAITLNPAAKEIKLEDWSNRIRVSVRETARNAYSAEIRAGSEMEWPAVTRTDDGKLAINDRNMTLTLIPAFAGYAVSGMVTDEDGRRSMVAVSVLVGADGLTVTGFATNLRVNKDSVTGYYDQGKYSPKAIAGVLTLVLAQRVPQP